MKQKLSKNSTIKLLSTRISSSSILLIGFGLICLYLAGIYKFGTSSSLNNFTIFTAYSILITLYLFARYTLSLRHTPDRYNLEKPVEWPTVAIVVPAYNEGRAIYRTIESISKIDYDPKKIGVVIVNDGSSDDTHQWIERAVQDFGTIWPMKYINKATNSGKRDCMYAGYNATVTPMVVFIDSDSIVEKNCIRELVRPMLQRSEIAAVSGHAYVTNAHKNLITRMQEIRYFSAFRALKAFESMLGYVSCCSGCCAAYRREDVDSVIKPWINQTFLGQRCTYGDDRSLTNLLLKRGKKAVYNQNAITFTKVPETYRSYAKQQLRWKKSWIRESAIQFSYAFKRNPLFVLVTMLNILLPLMAPFIVFRYMIWYVTVDFHTTLIYVCGLTFTCLLYGLYYKAYHPQSKNWLIGSLSFSVINMSLIWQLPYALLKLNDTKWGTR